MGRLYRIFLGLVSLSGVEIEAYFQDAQIVVFRLSIEAWIEVIWLSIALAGQNAIQGMGEYVGI
jgi:hypothetical protein